MDIQVIAKYLKQGYRVRRLVWGPECYLHNYYGETWSKMENFDGPYSISMADLLADDWEIITSGIIKEFPITYSD